MFLCLCSMSEVEERMGLRAGGFRGGQQQQQQCWVRLSSVGQCVL